MSIVYPKKRITRQELIAISLTCFLAWICAYLAIDIFRNYAFGLFIWLPFVIGLLSTLIQGYGVEIVKRRLRNISYLTLFIFCLGLLVFAWEGIICLIMALPIGAFFTWVGYRTGRFIINQKIKGTPAVIILLGFSVPLFMAFENSEKISETIYPVTTSVEINAPPEKVWENVIVFTPLKEPQEFIFKTGIAYPINATIDGHGVGAIRHCNFSTGSFVEPITVWDEPKLLRFSVVDQPEPMKELSFYNIHPNHLHGYWVSKQGQFKITRLANGHTLLEGTTWYANKIKPDFYWSIWSNYIVHCIHRRVLVHIKEESEK